MSNEIEATTTGTVDRGLHQAGEVSRYSDHERDMLRALGGLDEASDGDLDMLKTFADRTGLDPFIKQIYLIGRKTKTGGYRGEPERWETKWTVQTSIDGFRKVLFRYAESRGVGHQIGKPIFYSEDGQARPFWIKKWGNPVAAEVEVKVGDSIGYGIATWDEFVQTKSNGAPTSMWEKLGPTMLAKCAKAQAIRDVCDLAAGLYIPEEMMQADEPVRMEARRTSNRGRSGLQVALGQSAQNVVVDEPREIEAAKPDVNPVVADFTAKFTKAGSLDELRELSPKAGEIADEDALEQIRDAYKARAGQLQEESFDGLDQFGNPVGDAE